MSLAQGCLIVALVLVAVTHTMSRIGGALATIGWCVAALIFGVVTFQETGTGLVFMGIQTPGWLYVLAMLSVAAYNLAIVARGLRRRRREPPPPTTTTPAPPTPPQT